MLDIKFLGGLGNQMFIYALFVRLRRQFPEMKIHLDIDSYKYERFHHGFQLQKVFAIPEVFNIKDKYNLPERMWYKLTTNIKRYWYVWIRKDALLRDDGEFERKLKDIKKNRHYYVRGTWISDKYFSLVQKEVKEAFKFRPEIISPSVQKRIDNIKAEDFIPIALHVRRGDYTNSDFVSLAETDYYQLAIRQIEERELDKSLKIYLFSDDIEWCRKNLVFLNAYNIVYINDQKDYEDLFLMTQCEYVITANSTFSWWGGFLSNAKCVFAPRQISKKNILSEKDLSFIYPQSWTLI